MELFQRFRVHFHDSALLLAALRSDTSVVVVLDANRYGALAVLVQISSLILALPFINISLELVVPFGFGRILLLESVQLLLESYELLPLLVLHVADKVDERIAVFNQRLVKGQLLSDLCILFSYVHIVGPRVFL